MKSICYLLLVFPGLCLQPVTTNGVATIPFPLEADQKQYFDESPTKSLHEPQQKLNQEKPAEELQKNDTEQTWTDPDTGLMWTKEENGSDVSWNQASDYCNDLQLAGYKNWRLPTIEELQGVYDPGIRSPTGIAQGPQSVHVKGNLKITSFWDWSSTRGDAPAKGWPIAWVIGFSLSESPKKFFPIQFNYQTRALCVRDSGQ